MSEPLSKHKRIPGGPAAFRRILLGTICPAALIAGMVAPVRDAAYRKRLGLPPIEPTSLDPAPSAGEVETP